MKSKTVMVVDDDKEFLEELAIALELHGFNAIAVNDANNIVQAASRQMPDIVLLDLKMPRKSGFQAANDLKERPEFARIPIIAMSSCYKHKDSLLLKVHGIKKCISKPLRADTLVEEISRIVGE